MTTAKDARRVVYPRGTLQQALQPGPLPPEIVFRSNLEADWANTLDTLRIAWAHEPQLFTLPDGRQYLPDFHLAELGTWLEVKGTEVPGLDKTIEFARSQESLVIVGFSPAFTPGRGFRMRYRGVVRQAGLALCPECHRYQWAAADLKCRLCHAGIPRANFYTHDSAPFYPAHSAQWTGE